MQCAPLERQLEAQQLRPLAALNTASFVWVPEVPARLLECSRDRVCVCVCVCVREREREFFAFCFLLFVCLLLLVFCFFWFLLVVRFGGVSCCWGKWGETSFIVYCVTARYSRTENSCASLSPSDE